MLSMILKMSAVTAGNIILTYALWRLLKDKKIGWGYRLLLSFIYGGLAVLATHYGVDYQHMMLNIRDLAPLTAGLFFDPTAGIIAGIIGGVERYLVGTYCGVGTYTRIACSISTCLSGVVAALLRMVIFRGKKPSVMFSFFIGSTMEVFHMYVVFITHRSDMDMAFYVVKTCAPGMIIFTGIGLALISLIIRVDAGEWLSPRDIKEEKDLRVSQKFQFWLFLISAVVLISNLVFGNILQTQAARQKSKSILEHAVNTIEDTYNNMGDDEGRFSSISFSIGENGNYIIYGSNKVIIAGAHMGERIDENFINGSRYVSDDVTFFTDLFGEKCMCITRTISGGNKLIVYLTSDEVYGERDQIVYETVLADILLFTVIYILISILVQKIVVSNLEMVNRSLNKITSGNLNEVVSVYSSSEFASLSDDINQTVDVLKTYIEAAEKRIEEELTFARSIQESALPHNFTFPRDDFEVFATMDPAKEVGGDFFDFFFIDMNKVCFVMADVSGKGIPAALFMMKSKAIIRSFAESGKSPSEIFSMTNTELCEGNLEHMFVTVWIGIADLKTGHMVCSNAGHEYPMLMRDGGDYEIYKKKHNCALAIKKNAAFAEYEIDLKPGDSVFVYTDGIPEAIDTANNAYGTDRLVNVLNRYKNLPQKDMLKYVRRDITRFVGEAEQFDDVTMLGFRYYGQSEEKPADS